MKKLITILVFMTFASSPAWATAASCYNSAEVRLRICRSRCASGQVRCLLLCRRTFTSRLRACPGNPNPAEQTILDLVNQQRTQQGLASLIWDIRLGEAAQGHAANMAAHGQADHILDGKAPADRLRAAGYPFTYEAENIYWGQGAGHDSPQDAVNWWLGSPGHRANILSPTYTQSGIGVRKAGDGKWYFSESFATR